MRTRGAVEWVSLVLSFLLPALAWGAERPARRFSVSFYPFCYFPTFDSAFDHAYVPGPLDALPGSGASQVLTLQGAGEAGLAFALGYRFNELLGVRLTVGRAESGIKGENSPYVVIMKYVSRQPPSYEPKECTYESTRPWASTSGKLKTLSAVVGLEIGHDFSRLISGAATVGAGLYRVWGDFGPLGYTTAWLGGHSVLMMDNDLLFLKVPASWKPGLDLGAEVALSLGRGVVLSLRGGYSFVGKLKVVPVLDRVVSDPYLSPASPEEVSEIAAVLSLRPLRLSPSAFRLGVGLGIGF